MAPVVARARDKSGEAAPGVMPSPIAVLYGVEVQYLSSSFARVMCVLNFLNNVPHTHFYVSQGRRLDLHSIGTDAP
jgi:hypothetical protein